MQNRERLSSASGLPVSNKLRILFVQNLGEMGSSYLYNLRPIL